MLCASAEADKPGANMRSVTAYVAAKRLGVTASRVRLLCKQGRITARKCECGRDWLIDETELTKFASIKRKPGRPAARACGEEGER